MNLSSVLLKDRRVFYQYKMPSTNSPSTLIVDLTQNEDEMRHNLNNIEILQIARASSIDDCLELLTEDFFETQIRERPSFRGIIFKVNESIDDFQAIEYFCNERRIFISFQSTINQHESITCWKTDRPGYFYYLYLDDGDETITQFVHKFLIEEFKKGNLGVMTEFQDKNQLKLEHIGDENQNLLAISVLQERYDVMEKLIDYEFDPELIDMACLKYLALVKIWKENQKMSSCKDLISELAKMCAHYNIY